MKYGDFWLPRDDMERLLYSREAAGRTTIEAAEELLDMVALMIGSKNRDDPAARDRLTLVFESRQRRGV